MISTQYSNHYWALLKVLALPLGFGKWLLYIGAVLFAVGLGVWFLFDNPLLVVLGSIFLAFYCFLLGVVFPSSILSMVTSKQFSLLPNVRQSLFIIQTVFIFLATSIISLFVWLGSEKIGNASSGIALLDIVSFGLVTLFVISFAMLGLIYLLSIWPGAYLVVCIPLVGAASLESLFSGIPLLVVLFLVVLVWAAYTRWWFSWRPKTFFSNYLVFPQTEIGKQNAFGFVGLERNLTYFEKPKNLVDTLLMDGATVSVFLARGFWGVAFIALMYFFYQFYFGGNLEPSSFNKVLISTVVVFLVHTRGTIGVSSVYRNVKKLWIYYPADRATLFNKIESLNVRCAIAGLVFPVLAGVAAALFAPQMFIGPLQFFWALLFGLVLGTVCFYSALLVYALKGASSAWMTWTALLLVLAAIFFWSCASWYLDDGSLQVQLILGAVAAMCILLIFGLRRWAKHCWHCIDLVGVH